MTNVLRIHVILKAILVSFKEARLFLSVLVVLLLFIVITPLCHFFRPPIFINEATKKLESQLYSLHCDSALVTPVPT